MSAAQASLATPVRVAVYARISPKPEGAVGDNYSLDSQLDACREKALATHGCATPLEYVDRLVSGASLDRPALDRLRDDLRRKQVDIVIAYSPDRWTRQSLDAHILLDEIRKAGARLEFVSGSYDTSPEGDFSYAVQTLVSEFERKKFMERSRRGRARKAKEGYLHSCSAQIGYEYVGANEGSRGEYRIVEKEAELVRRVYEMAAEGKTQYEIAKIFNEEKVPTPRKPSAKRMWKGQPHVFSGKWFPYSIGRILDKKRTAYYGERVEMGQIIKTPAIISRDLWDRARAKQEANAATQVGRPSKNYLLSGFLYCTCGKRCTTSPNSGRGKYLCFAGKSVAGIKRSCFQQGIHQHKIETLVWDALWSTISSSSELYAQIAAYYDSLAKTPKPKQDSDAKKLEKARRAVAHHTRLMSDPEQPVAYEIVKANLAQAKQELAAIERQMSVTSIGQRPPKVSIDHLVKTFKAGVNLEDFANRRGVLKRIVESVVFGDKLVRIHCKLVISSVINHNRREYGSCDSTTEIPFVIERRVA